MKTSNKKHSVTQEIVPLTDETQEFLNWLKTQGPKPPNKKEQKRMAKAIEDDLRCCEQRLGETPEQRLQSFKSLGYLYEECNL